MKGKYSVAVYRQDRLYGGPEEGGWWYDTGDLVRTCRRFRHEAAAYAYCRRMNDLMRVLVHDAGVYGAEVHEGPAPQSYPVTRPFYE